MDAIVVSYRRGRRTQNTRQVILTIPGVTSREEAEKLVGKTIVWTSPGREKKEITGVISAPHGNNGAVRVRLERGLPGQALGGKVTIRE